MNIQVTLANRPKGMPTLDDFAIIESPIPQPSDGEILVRTLWLSVDPYMRGRMRDRKSYAPPVQIGDVMVGEIVGVVERSRTDQFREGDIVQGHLGWQQYAVTQPDRVRRVPDDLPISTALHVAGMPGLTAYFGLLEIGKPKPNDTVVVSGGAGAVGSTVGQIAKIKGCRVVGVAGSDEKVRFMTDLGFDRGINYKTSENIFKSLRSACFDGIDVYFDNVGGPITDAAFGLINVHARMVICGQISQYNSEEPEQGPRVLWNLIPTRATVQGMLVTDFAERWPQALEQLRQWIKEGRIQYRETVVEGIQKAPQAFLDLFQGSNIGKQLVKVSDL